MEQIHVKEFITVHRIVFNRQAAGEDRVGVTTLVGLRQPEFNCNVLSLSTQSPNASSLISTLYHRLNCLETLPFTPAMANTYITHIWQGLPRTVRSQASKRLRSKQFHNETKPGKTLFPEALHISGKLRMALWRNLANILSAWKAI